MDKNNASKTTPGASARQRLLVAAQVFSLLAMAMGLQFVMNTTGGTLFLFATVAPLLVTGSIALLAGVMIYSFRKRHSLFNFESYEPGQIIFRKGDAGECAYFIKEGEVEVLGDELQEGCPTVIATLSKGQYFGEMSLLSNVARNATVRARTATKLAVLGKQNFLNMLHVIPNVHEDFMKTVQERNR